MPEVQEIINSADSLALSKLLQIISTSSFDLPCDILSFYSDEIIGMMRLGIQKNTLTSELLVTIINTAEQ